jgi:ABC-type antimicrobial peptide transport system permease subunit
MGARDKLNQACINGAVITGTTLGIATESWPIFWIAGIYCLATSIHVGEIRFTGRGRKR